MRKYIILLILVASVILSCKKTKVTDVQLNKSELTLIVGETETLIATVLPKDADNKAVSWQSNNSNVAIIVDNDGTVTAKATGTALITVTTADGNKTANCTLIVKPFKEPEMIFVEGNDSIKSFYISKYPVTQKLWKDVLEPYYQIRFNDGDNYPAYDVSLFAHLVFIPALNLATGKNYRLPTEDEWKYAAKGGNKSKGYEYSGSNNIDEVAWCKENSNDTTHPIGIKLPNELGIYDMSGNVWEWVLTGTDIYGGNYYTVYGGSYYSPAHNCRISSSYFDGGSFLRKDFGLRLALDSK